MFQEELLEVSVMILQEELFRLHRNNLIKLIDMHTPLGSREEEGWLWCDKSVSKLKSNWMQHTGLEKRKVVRFNTPFPPSLSPITPTSHLVLWEVAERDPIVHSENQWDSASYRAAPVLLSISALHLMTTQLSNISLSWYWLVFLPKSLLDLLQIKSSTN